MKKLLCFGALALLTACTGLRGPTPADLVLRHGHIRTMAPARPWVQALAIADGKLIYTGDEEGVERFIGPDTRVVELGDRLVLPGFHDAHVHLLESGLELRECFVGGLPDRAAITQRVKAYADRHPELKWIRGSGWELTTFPGGNPRKEWLDAVVKDRPVYISASDGHSAWLNSKALALAGIRKGTPNPPNGRIERDPKTGEPSGTLREDALDVVTNLIPARTDEDRGAALAESQAEANRLGITAVIEANCDEDFLQAYQTAEDAGTLNVRIVAAQMTDPARGPAQVPALVARRQRYSGKLVTPGAVKFFVDGVIEAKTAAMLAPYLDPKTGKPTRDRGDANWSAPALNATVVALDAAGLQAHMHAIGDRAVRLGLDAIEAARKANGEHDARHTIAHMEQIDPADVPRFKSLGVVAAFQPFWAMRDEYIVDLTEPVLGPRRSQRIYPIGEVLRSGAHLAFGSDWSVSSLSPLDGMQVAVTRRKLEDGPGEAWLPAQAVELDAAIAAYTSGGAWASHREDWLGTLEPGKAADLVVLDRDLYRIPAHTIHETKVLLTMLGGRSVYKAPGKPL